jgi:hypothetical protein
VHLTMRFNRTAKLDDSARRYTYIECLSNIRNVNGKPQQTTDADPRFIDYYGGRGLRTGKNISRSVGKSPTMICPPTFWTF